MNSFPSLKSLQIPWLHGRSPNPKDCARNVLTLLASMIAIFDEDGGGDVDFQEFVSGLSAFSSKGNKEEKLRFAFKVYDIDRDGYISNGELFIVLKMMVGSNLKDQQLQQVRSRTKVKVKELGRYLGSPNACATGCEEGPLNGFG